jgi:hypothetical protein
LNNNATIIQARENMPTKINKLRIGFFFIFFMVGPLVSSIRILILSLLLFIGGNLNNMGCKLKGKLILNFIALTQ